MRAAAMGVRRAWTGLLDALLPPHCLTCDSPVAGQGTLCPGCWRGLAFVTEPICARCGVPFLHAGQGGGSGLCPACRDHPPAFGQARAALRYDDGARRLILPFKHGDRTELARPLAAQMARAGAGLLARAELLVPVPLHWRRLLKRRYNQAALLAGWLGRAAGLPVLPAALRRTRPTPPLEGMGAAERAAVLAGAVAVHPRAAARIAGRRVLLVDDVMTSGATADAASRALLAAGAAGVDVLAAARVPDPRLQAEA